MRYLVQTSTDGRTFDRTVTLTNDRAFAQASFDAVVNDSPQGVTAVRFGYESDTLGFVPHDIVDLTV